MKGDGELMVQTPEEKKAKRRIYEEGRAEKRKPYFKAYFQKYYTEDPEAEEHREANRHHITAYKKRQEASLRDYKRTLKCSMCGQSFPDCPAVIEFHHLDGDDKFSGIGRMGTVSKARLEAEVAKCIPLCANCHRKVHYLERQRKKKAV